MNLHIVSWDEESALWRTRVLTQIDPKEPIVKCSRGSQPWLAWNTGQAPVEFVEVESVGAHISNEGDILLYYRPTLEYWNGVNFEAACHVKWLEREWPTFGEVALEELNSIAQIIQKDSKQPCPLCSNSV